MSLGEQLREQVGATGPQLPLPARSAVEGVVPILLSAP